MSKFDPLKGLTTEKKKTFNFNPLKGISDEQIPTSVKTEAPSPVNNFNMPVSYLSQGKITPPTPPQDESFLKKTARVLLPKAAEEYLGMNKTPEQKQSEKDFKSAYENKWAIEDTQKLQERIDPTTGKLPTQTAMDVLKETPGEKYLPFVGAIPSIKDAVSLYGAAKRLESGENTPVDDYILAKFKAESERDSTFGAKVMDILTEIPAFAGELAITGGIFTGVKKATQKAITEGLETTVEKTARRKMLESLLTRSIGSAAGATAQTIPARFMEITAETIQNMTPEYQYRPGEDKLFNAYISKEGDNVWKSAAKALSNQWVEVLSEKSGGIFNEMAAPLKSKILKLGVFKALAKNNPNLTTNKFMQLVNAAGWDGIFAEMGEERIGELMRGLLTQVGLSEDGFRFPSKEQLLLELVSFSIPGVMIGSVNKAREAAELYESMTPGQRQAGFIANPMSFQPEGRESTPTMTPDEVSASPSVQEVPFDLPPDTPELVKSEHKRTPESQKINWFDKFATPLYPLEKIGLRANYQEMKGALLDMYKEKVIIHEQLANWMKQVPGKESSERIFKFLDGESIQLNPQESKVVSEIRPWLDQWADRMGIKKEERISNYITHIFPKEADAGIPEEIAAIIRNKIPGEVYNPFLLERLGAEGYIKDVWMALDAYSKRAVRKVHLDPALANLKELVGPGKQVSEDSQIQYVQDIIDNLNMRPTKADIITDNTIKRVFGNTFGARPTRNITLFFRKLIYGSKIGLSITTFAKNLTQGVNTYSELGEQYTAIGYIDLARNGGQELKDNGVLLNSQVEDQVYSAVKKYAEIYDQVLFLNMNASELVNRGAAYYGAKAKFLAGKINSDEFKKAFGTEKPQNYKPTVEEAIAYGKFIAEKTQFSFGPLDNPSVLSSDLMKTTFQLSSFNIRQQEFVIRKIIDREWLKLARYFLSSFLLYGLVGQVFGMSWKDVFPYVKFGTPPILQFIWDDLFKIGILGRDKYGNYLDAGERAKRIGKSLFTNVMPGGAQIKRTYEGIKLVNEGGQRNARGYYDYKVEKTPMNYLRASLFGPSNLSETKDYFKKKDEKKKGSSKSKGSFNPLKGM